VAGILQRVIQVLDRLYNFPGGTRGLAEFDLAGAIQPVHDLSRMADMGARGAEDNGYLYVSSNLANISGGAATTLDLVVPYTSFDASAAAQNFRSVDHRLWLVDVYCTVDPTNAGNWTETIATIQIRNKMTQDGIQILQRWNADHFAPISGGLRPATIDQDFASQVQFPLFLPSESLLAIGMVSTNDCESTVYTTWWAGPIGVSPPGML